MAKVRKVLRPPYEGDHITYDEARAAWRAVKAEVDAAYEAKKKQRAALAAKRAKKRSNG